MKRPVSSFLVLALAVGVNAAQGEARYVPMEDGTRLAVDVHLPEGASASERCPALLELTRYWRSSENASTGVPNGGLGQLDRAFLDAGYALVKVDVRGTGASFGTRTMEYGREEVRDGYDVIEWVVAQPWCDGNVGAYGTSYTGTTADLITATGHPALRAVVPGWSDFDLYRGVARPYGLLVDFIERWGTMVGWMDANATRELGASVRRVDADEDGALLAAAIEEHAPNVDVDEAVLACEFRDDRLVEDGDSYAEATPLHWKEEIEASGVPMLVFASWLDAGTADGALQRLRHFSNPQKVMILASSHGGVWHASPFEVHQNRLAPEPAFEDQIGMRIDFFDHHLRGAENGVDEWPALRYYNLGEEAFRESEAWPVDGVSSERFFLGADRVLSTDAPDDAPGWASYDVDFDVTTGRWTRWTTQLGGPVLALDDRGAMDARMLTYTSPVLETPLQVTGEPIVHLRLTSTATDGAVLVYLEDVAPDGRSRYITEGGLKASHRRLSENPHYASPLPYHSHSRADAAPIVPGEELELVFQLWPTSVLFQPGHRIRIAIAGADAGTLERVPAEGDVTLKVSGASFVDLPVVAD